MATKPMHIRQTKSIPQLQEAWSNIFPRVSLTRQRKKIIPKCIVRLLCVGLSVAFTYVYLYIKRVCVCVCVCIRTYVNI